MNCKLKLTEKQKIATLRLQADFENYKRRVQIDKEAMINIEHKILFQIFYQLLITLKEQCKWKQTDEQTKSLLQGMEMVYRQIDRSVDKRRC